MESTHVLLRGLASQTLHASAVVDVRDAIWHVAATPGCSPSSTVVDDAASDPGCAEHPAFTGCVFGKSGEDRLNPSFFINRRS